MEAKAGPVVAMTTIIARIPLHVARLNICILLTDGYFDFSGGDASVLG
jgi:hypothetical protein